MGSFATPTRCDSNALVSTFFAGRIGADAIVTRRLVVVAAITAALTVTGCSGDNRDSSAVESTAQVPLGGQTSEAEVVLAEYFQKLASNVPGPTEQAVELAAPGSVAAKYARSRANTMAAYVDLGLEIGPSEYRVEDDTAEVCSPSDPTMCATFADFTYDDGMLAGFTYNGVDLRDRLLLGNGTVAKSRDLAGFELLSAYQSASDESLNAVFRFHSYDRAIDTSYTVVYRDPSGGQVYGPEQLLPSRLAPNSNRIGLVSLPPAELGGEFIFKFATADDRGPLVVQEVHVPAGARR